MSLDVSDTAIKCYSGCLTSSAVYIEGASPNCHNGTITRDFLLIVGGVLLLGAMFTCAYYRRGLLVASDPVSDSSTGVCAH